MKALDRIVDRIDQWQQHNRVVAPAYAVIKKFGDDQANLYVVSLGWYGFTGIYPLLLVVVTIFGFIGSSLGTGIVKTLSKFPVIGSDFKIGPNQHVSTLHGSTLGLIIGALGLLYGAQGVTQTAQTTMAQVWNVPQMKRGGFLPRLGRSVAGLVIIGGAFVINAFVGTFIGGHGQALWLRIVLTAGLVALNVGLYYAAFWFLTPPVPDRRLLPGAIVGAVGFTALTTIGTGLIEHQLSHASATYGAFASVIALVTYLLLLAKITVYAAELNPVVARHLWPRALPMAPPTEADEKVLSALAAEEQRWPEQKVKVSYQPDPVADGVPPGQTEPTDREPQPAAREPEPAWAGAPRRNYGRAGAGAGGDGDGDRHGAGEGGGDDGGGGGGDGDPRENRLPPRPPWPSTWPRPEVNQPRRAGN
jgi:uncharacterized BrkB/YihY/UPF0761 family membrane protein